MITTSAVTKRNIDVVWDKVEEFMTLMRVSSLRQAEEMCSITVAAKWGLTREKREATSVMDVENDSRRSSRAVGYAAPSGNR